MKWQRNSHTKELQLSKAFGGWVGLWESQRTNRTQRIVKSGEDPTNSSQKEMVNSKGDENLWLHTRVEKNGVSTTMKVSTKWPKEDYARVSCQRKERPQLVCQKRISNRFVHLPWCALFYLFCLQAWFSLCIGRLCIFLFFFFFLSFFYSFSFSPFLCYYVNFCICPHTLTFQWQVHNA